MRWLSDFAKRNAAFTYCSFLIFWGVMTYSEIARFFREGTLFARVVQGHPYINDFLLFYNSAQLAGRGTEVNIYDPATQEIGMKALAAPVVPELNFYMQYPPHFFALVRPLAFLSVGMAYIVWVCGWIFCNCVTLWFLIRDAAISKTGRIFIYSGLFASYPAWMMVQLGQSVLFQLPGTIGFWLLLRSKRYFLAGLVSALLLVKLQYVPLFVLIGVILGRLRYAGGLAISILVIGVISLIELGPANILAYPQALMFGETSDKVSGVSAYLMQNIRGELILLTGGEGRVVHLTVLAAFAISIPLFAAIWLKLFPRWSQIFSHVPAFNYCAAITALLMLCLSPHTHTHDYVTTVIPLVLLYPLCSMESAGRWKRRVLKFLILGAPLLSWVFFLLQVVFLIIRIQPFFAWNLAVLLLSWLILREQQAAKAEAAP